MMKKFKRISALFVVGLILSPLFTQNTLAQMMPDRVLAEAEQTTINNIEIDESLINRNNVAICNDSEQDIKIILGDMYSAPDTFLIEKNSLWYSKTYNKKELFISIQTGNNIIKYTLISGKAYILCWNDNKKYWYLQKLFRD
jgi:hypothetical protein